jgi:hypothetical protein
MYVVYGWDDSPSYLRKEAVADNSCFSSLLQENMDKCHGSKMENLASWRKFAEIGKQTDRTVISSEAVIDVIAEGPGEHLPTIEDDWPLF